MDELAFEVLDRNGIPVQLKADRWERHIKVKHPEVAPFIEEAKVVICSPNITTEDSKGVCHLAALGVVTGNKWRNLYLEIIVRYSGVRGEVLTIHFNGAPPKGELKWIQK